MKNKSMVEAMHPGLIVSSPYAGNPEKVKKIRERLIKSTQENSKEFYRAQAVSYEAIKNKEIKTWQK